MKPRLLSALIAHPEVSPIESDPKLLAEIAALGIQQEVGTIHDELAPFLFDEKNGTLISREKLRAELVQWKGYTGVKIWAEGVDMIDVRVKGLKALMHPEMALTFFPEIIAQIIGFEKVEVVVVKPWAMNTIFGGFDPQKYYYEGNLWELINIDVYRYAKMLEKRQVALLGTHDLVAHVAGLTDSTWSELQSLGTEVRILLEDYFSEIQKPSLASLVVPYALGMLLDDLAQPASYDSKSRKAVVRLLIDSIRSGVIDPKSGNTLMKYPSSVELLFNLARGNDEMRALIEAPQIIAALVNEIKKSDLAIPLL